MEFGLLGPLRVERDGIPIPVSAAKQRMILTALLLRAGTTVQADQLIDVIWGDHPPRSARASLHAYVLRLRKLLADPQARQLRTSGSGYLIEVANDELDVSRFTALRSAARRAGDEGRWADAVASHQAALGLWRAEALSDVPGFEAHEEVTRLTELRWQTTEDWIQAQLMLGRDADVVPELRALTSTHPLREQFHEQLMLALYRTGRQAESLDAYRRAREVISSELGVEPGPGLRGLHETVLRGDPPRPVKAQPAVVPAQLPADIADFTGRRAEVAAITGWLSEDHPRAVTVAVLTGPAGAGKTALAVHAAHLAAGHFPDGVLYARLRGSTSHPASHDEIIDRFLAALGADPASLPADVDARQAAYRSVLAGRRVLILLDDAADSAQVYPLLPGASGSAILITSKTYLADLAGSRIVRLAGMDADDALALLGRRAGPERVSAEPAAAAEIVDACAGLPLALTIAGARLAARPRWRVRDLADMLGPESDRLDELTYGDLAVRKTFDLSYNALRDRAPEGSELVGTLLLTGLWTGCDISAQAAAALLGTSTQLARTRLEALTDLNLVDSEAAGRYYLHDLVRAYTVNRARDELPPQELAEAARRVVTWYLHGVDNANRAAERLRRQLDPDRTPESGPTFGDVASALDWLTAERANLLAAIQMAADHAIHDAAWQLPWLLEEFYFSRLHLAEWHAACQIGLVSAEHSGDTPAQARMLEVLANHHRAVGQPAESMAHRQRAIALYRRTGDRAREANAMASAGMDYLASGNLDEAIIWCQKAVPGVRAHSTAFALSAVLNCLGSAYQEAGQLDLAIEAGRDALEATRVAGSRLAEAATLDGLGVAYHQADRLDQAVDSLRRAVDLQHELAEARGEAVTLEHLSAALRTAGKESEAAACADRARAIYASLQLPARASAAGRAEARTRGKLGSAFGAVLDGRGHRLAAIRAELGTRRTGRVT
jgi:DNA-binding SARP family transcriptional activator/Tfp pilus assembly protein PilF